MYDDIFPWYNVDVNCDGTEGDWVTGLNERNMWNNFEFASVADNYDLVVAPANVGYTWTGENFGGEDLCTCLGLGWSGDFACESWDFDAEGGSSLGHSELPEYTDFNLWALDEPDEYEFSYEIELDKVYAGFITPQGTGGSYVSDYDDYRIYVPNSGELTVSTEFLGTYSGDDMYLYEVSTDTYIAGIQDVGASETMTANVNPGWYVVEFNGTQINSFSQYFFGVTMSGLANQEELEDERIQIYPIPSNGVFYFDGVAAGEDVECTVANSFGQVVLSAIVNSSKPEIDLSGFPSGIYTVHLVGESYSWNRKVLKSN